MLGSMQGFNGNGNGASGGVNLGVDTALGIIGSLVTAVVSGGQQKQPCAPQYGADQIGQNSDNSAMQSLMSALQRAGIGNSNGSGNGSNGYGSGYGNSGAGSSNANLNQICELLEKAISDQQGHSGQMQGPGQRGGCNKGSGNQGQMGYPRGMGNQGQMGYPNPMGNQGQMGYPSGWGNRNMQGNNSVNQGFNQGFSQGYNQGLNQGLRQGYNGGGTLGNPSQNGNIGGQFTGTYPGNYRGGPVGNSVGTGSSSSIPQNCSPVVNNPQPPVNNNCGPKPAPVNNYCPPKPAPVTNNCPPTPPPVNNNCPPVKNTQPMPPPVNNNYPPTPPPVQNNCPPTPPPVNNNCPPAPVNNNCPPGQVAQKPQGFETSNGFDFKSVGDPHIETSVNGGTAVKKDNSNDIANFNTIKDTKGGATTASTETTDKDKNGVSFNKEVNLLHAGQNAWSLEATKAPKGNAVDATLTQANGTKTKLSESRPITTADGDSFTVNNGAVTVNQSTLTGGQVQSIITPNVGGLDLEQKGTGHAVLAGDALAQAITGQAIPGQAIPGQSVNG